MLFTNNHAYPIGLDISDLSLKLIQFSKNGGKIKLQALSKVNLPQGLIVNGEIKQFEKVVDFVNKLIRKPLFGKVTSDSVVACLPEHKTFLQTVEIENTPNNLADVIEAEIEKNIPINIEDVYYDWQTICKHSKSSSVLIGVAPKHIVDQYTHLFDQVKLSIDALELEPIALCRALLTEENCQFKGESATYIIIDIGAVTTSLILYAKNSIIFTVDIPISGEEITKQISETLKIDLKQAEKAKIVCGLDKDKAQGVVNKVLSDTISNLNKKVKKSLEFYNNNFSDYGPVKQIYLSGGGANIKKIDSIIKKNIGIKTVKANPWINLGQAQIKVGDVLSEKYDFNFFKDKNKKADKLTVTQDISLSFSTAIGLALRGIFIKDPMSKQ